MAPFTRSQTPLTTQRLSQLDHNLTNRVLLYVLVGLSATAPDWYPILASVSKRVKRQVDSMLQDPSVLSSVTLWDNSETCYQSAALRKQQKCLDRFCLHKVTNITVVVTEGDDFDITGHNSSYVLYTRSFPLGSRFGSLQHLCLRGASNQQLPIYLSHFTRQDQTSQLTDISLTDYRVLAGRLSLTYTICWPMKIILSNVVCEDECDAVCLMNLFRGVPDGVDLHIGSVSSIVVRQFQAALLEYVGKSVRITMRPRSCMHIQNHGECS